MCAIDETSERRDTKMKRRMEKTKNKERERERENKGSKKNAARGVVRVVTCLDATAHPSSSRLERERERERDLCNPLLFPKGNIFPNPESLLFCLRTNRQKPFSLLCGPKRVLLRPTTPTLFFFPSQKRRVLFVRSFVLWARTRTAMWCWRQCSRMAERSSMPRKSCRRIARWCWRPCSRTARRSHMLRRNCRRSCF